MPQIDIEYKTIMLASQDEATSLAGYLNEHGIFAVVNAEDHSVSATTATADDDAAIRVLKGTWRMFWDNSDSGLFGLPLFVKES